MAAQFGASLNHDESRTTTAMSNSLKRPHSVLGVKSAIPPLPLINGEVILEVFTHKSLHFSPGHPELGDNTRLAELGSHALDVVVTSILFDLREPMLKVEDIQVRTKSANHITES